MLAGRPDGSVTLLSVGFLTNLDALLRSGPDEASPLDGVGLVRRKVKEWACMGGRFPASVESGEFNLATYPEATAYVLFHWPTPAMFSGFEIGVRVKTGARLIREHPPAGSPVSRAYLESPGARTGRAGTRRPRSTPCAAWSTTARPTSPRSPAGT